MKVDLLEFVTNIFANDIKPVNVQLQENYIIRYKRDLSLKKYPMKELNY